MSIVSAATLIGGPTGSGKTTLCATLAKGLYKKHKKVTLLYSADPGGWGDKVQALINLGIIRAWRVRTRDADGHFGLPLETLERATQGYWPEKIDPKTGDTEPKVKLIAPTIETFTVICQCGEPGQTVNLQSQIKDTKCKCGLVVGSQSCKEIRKTVSPASGFEDVGAVFFDSLSSFSEWSGRDMQTRSARGEYGGEKNAIGTLLSGGAKFGGLNRSSIGFVQERACGWVGNANTIRGLLVPPVFTCLEDQTNDDSGVNFYGPKIMGRAKTAEIPSWFGNYLCTEVYTDAETKEWRLHLQEYRGQDGIPHRSKNRCSPGTLPAYLTDGPVKSKEEMAFEKFNLWHFFELVEAQLAKEQSSVSTEFEGIELPALRGTFGSTPAPAPPGPAPTGLNRPPQAAPTVSGPQRAPVASAPVAGGKR